MGKLEGKVALITGAGTGIGRSSAVLFAEERAKVVVVDYVVAEGQKTASTIKDKGGEAIFVEADVSKVDQIEKMVKAAMDAFGRIDILFNNAGISAVNRALTANLSIEDWDRVLDINLKAAFVASKFVIPIMLNQGGGIIINTSSVNGLGANMTIAPYCASKAGLILLTKVIAAEYGKMNIRANAICPGMIDTPMVHDLLPFMHLDYIAQGRVGEPNEVSKAALFLASDDSSYVNGTALVVDGGWSAEAKLPVRLLLSSK